MENNELSQRSCTICGAHIVRNPRFSEASYAKKLTCSAACTKKLPRAIANEKNDVRDYSPPIDEDCFDYRTIALKMTEAGFKMNHSSVRNYVIRVMKKFLVAYNKHHSIHLNEESLNEIANSSSFHHAMSDVVQAINSYNERLRTSVKRCAEECTGGDPTTTPEAKKIDTAEVRF